MKLSGFGLTSTESICYAAYLAAWARSLHELPKRFLCIANQLNEYISTSKTGLILQELVAQLPSKSNSEEVKPQFHSLEKMIDYPRKLQHRLTLDISQKQSEDFIKNIKSNRGAARLRSLQGKGAGAWLDVTPSTYKNALKPNEFCLASCLRLGISLPFSQLLEHCDCRQKLDQEGFHLITSKYGSNPVWSHNTIVTEWSACLTELGIPHQTEPRNKYVQTDGRPDITFYDIDSGVTYECDVSLAHPWRKDIVNGAHPWRKDIVNGAAKACKHAVAKQESEKCYKYLKVILPDASSSEIVLLVLSISAYGDYKRKTYCTNWEERQSSLKEDE